MEDASIPSCCALLGYSKQAYYKQYSSHEQCVLQEGLILQEVCAIRKEMPVLGVRKLYHLLRGRLPPGVLPGRDAFFALLGENGLLVRRQKRTSPVTTISWHHFHKYPNLYKGYTPLCANMVWVADITYIRLSDGHFLYLSLLTDAYSHKIVGWYLSDSLSLEGALHALKLALGELPRDHSLIHHSDRGVQYCSNAYTAILKANGIQISMTQNGDPRENAVAERLNGILKDEWINREEIVSLEYGRERIKEIVDIYNKKRPHMSNGYMTPEKAHSQQGKLKRQWKTYYKKKENFNTIIEECVSLPEESLVDRGGTTPVNQG